TAKRRCLFSSTAIHFPLWPFCSSNWETRVCPNEQFDLTPCQTVGNVPNPEYALKVTEAPIESVTPPTHRTFLSPSMAIRRSTRIAARRNGDPPLSSRFSSAERDDERKTLRAEIKSMRSEISTTFRTLSPALQATLCTHISCFQFLHAEGIISVNAGNMGRDQSWQTVTECDTEQDRSTTGKWRPPCPSRRQQQRTSHTSMSVRSSPVLTRQKTIKLGRGSLGRATPLPSRAAQQPVVPPTSERNPESTPPRLFFRSSPRPTTRRRYSHLVARCSSCSFSPNSKTNVSTKRSHHKHPKPDTTQTNHHNRTAPWLSPGESILLPPSPASPHAYDLALCVRAPRDRRPIVASHVRVHMLHRPTRRALTPPPTTNNPTSHCVPFILTATAPERTVCVADVAENMQPGDHRIVKILWEPADMVRRGKKTIYWLDEDLDKALRVLAQRNWPVGAA
ncbi:hypothetical protein DFJ77DRAFT_532300, partial [Powellomyces hirtus]